MRTIFCLLLLALSASANAATVTLSEKSLNRELLKHFPIELSYQGVTAVFSEPKLFLDVLDNELELHVMISASDPQHTLRAKGILREQVRLDSINNILHFKHPKLDEFYLVSEAVEADKPLIKAIKQGIGDSLPEITLADLNLINSQQILSQPTSIEIRAKSLALIFPERL